MQGGPSLTLGLHLVTKQRGSVVPLCLVFLSAVPGSLLLLQYFVYRHTHKTLKYLTLPDRSKSSLSSKSFLLFPSAEQSTDDELDSSRIRLVLGSMRLSGRVQALLALVAVPVGALASLPPAAGAGDRSANLPLIAGDAAVQAPPEHDGGSLRASSAVSASSLATLDTNMLSPTFSSPHHTVRGGRRLADVGRCKGLFIATKAEDEADATDDFIMSSGVMSDNWNGQQVNMATADEDVREFYL